ncbi:hypothetical protein ABB37_08838 [Leptomonas pyrrhocoris]|uniref:Secreted protein n=1 Tax=Leptomonas pyrrhocoris TaxID=157538 RepID=A0A0M9FSV9_LEPPY|nr:hypothetical protein ABB37_08838 [Leptomonas pyrrhocoris]KPA75176.1 hypothetical protein ABB37_08838 [Leptomonas pyrrhocoris]|eukprot:XP_015653615.1 hypothetical protein ABB37_08838 [Leptomonas pyrrhocoris]
MYVRMNCFHHCSRLLSFSLLLSLSRCLSASLIHLYLVIQCNSPLLSLRVCGASPMVSPLLLFNYYPAAVEIYIYIGKKEELALTCLGAHRCVSHRHFFLFS